MKRIPRRAPRTVPVTAARACLFDLVEEVLTGRTERIELSHRSHEDHVVLIRKSEIEGMEADLQALRGANAPEPRPLRGTATLNVQPEAVLERTRRRQAELMAKKRAVLLGD